MYIAKKRKGETRQEREREREGEEVEKWDKGRFLRSLVERQLDRGKGEPLVTEFRRYTVMQYALGLPLDVVGLKKTPGVDGEKDHDAHEGGGSVRQEAQQPSCLFRHFSRAMQHSAMVISTAMVIPIPMLIHMISSLIPLQPFPESMLDLSCTRHLALGFCQPGGGGDKCDMSTIYVNYLCITDWQKNCILNLGNVNSFVRVTIFQIIVKRIYILLCI